MSRRRDFNSGFGLLPRVDAVYGADVYMPVWLTETGQAYNVAQATYMRYLGTGTPTAGKVLYGDGRWDAVAGGYSVSSRADLVTQAAAGELAADLDAVRVEGYAAAGDGGAAVYVRRSAATVAAYGLSSDALALLAVENDDGDYWVFDEVEISPRALGHDGGVVTGAPTAGTGPTWREVASAVNEYCLAVKPEGVTLLFEERYLFGDGDPWGPEDRVALAARRWSGGVVAQGVSSDICPALIVDPLDGGGGTVVRWLKLARPRLQATGFGVINKHVDDITPATCEDAFRRKDGFSGPGIVIGEGGANLPSDAGTDLLALLATDPDAANDEVANTAQVDLTCILGFRWGVVANGVNRADIRVKQIDAEYPKILGNVGAKATFSLGTSKGWTTANMAGSNASITITSAYRNASGKLEVTLANRHCYAVGRSNKVQIPNNSVKVNGVNVTQNIGTDAYMVDRTTIEFTGISVAFGAVVTLDAVPIVNVRPGGTKRRVPIQSIGDDGSGNTRIVTYMPHDLGNGASGTKRRPFSVVAPNDDPDTTLLADGHYQVLEGTGCRWLVDADTYANVVNSTTIDVVQADGTPLPWQGGTTVTAADVYVLTSQTEGDSFYYNMDQSAVEDEFNWSTKGARVASGGLRWLNVGFGGEGDANIVDGRTGLDLLPGTNDFMVGFAEITRPGAYAIRTNAGGQEVARVIAEYITFGLGKTFIVGAASGLLVVGSTLKRASTAPHMLVEIDDAATGLFIVGGTVEGEIYVTSQAGGTMAGQKRLIVETFDRSTPGRKRNIWGAGGVIQTAVPGASPSTPATFYDAWAVDTDGKVSSFVLGGLTTAQIAALTGLYAREGSVTWDRTLHRLKLRLADSGAVATVLTDADFTLPTTLQVTTTNTTPTKLTTDGGAATNTNTVRNTTDYSGWQVNVRVTARDAATGDYASWTRDIDFIRKSNVSTTAVLGGGTAIAPDRSSGALSACALDLTADTTNARLDVVGTGVTATTVTWKATLVFHAS